MNKIDKILTLIEKGYSKQEIDAMLAAEPAPAAEPEPPEEDPVPAADPEPPEENNGNNDNMQALTGFMEDLKKSITDLTAAVQAKNIQTNSVSTTQADDLNAILASYINPPGRDNK